MPKLLEGHTRPVAQNLIASFIFEALRFGGSPVVGWLAKRFTEVYFGISTGWAITIWVVVGTLFALLLTLAKHRLQRGETSTRPVASNPIPVAPPALPPITISPTISPVFNNSPRIDQRPVNYQTQEHVQQQSLGSVALDPVFECEDDPRVVIYGIDGRTSELVRQSPTVPLSEIPDYMTIMKTVLIPIYYRPERGVDHTVYLSAHVIFHSPERIRLKRVVFGIWDGDPLQSSKRIQTGTTLDLIAAMVPMGAESVFGAEYHQEAYETYMGKDVYEAPRLVPVQGRDLLLDVELLPKRISKDPFPSQHLWFRLAVTEGILEVVRIESPEQNRFNNAS
jgi:hypothetical protein